MSAFIGPELLARLTADKCGLDAATAKKVLEAYGAVVRKLLEDGARVRALDIGYFEVIRTKATRRVSPISGEVKVPAKNKIVFRESRKK